jgi:outer membrane murein-binding lipoprotein Lpp
MKSGWKMMSLLAVVLVFAWVAACSQKKEDTPQAQEQAPAAQEQVAQDQAAAPQEQEQALEQDAEANEEEAQIAESDDSESEMVEVSGTLVKTEEGVGLFSDSGNYLLDQDLSDMVGQNVKVIGIPGEIDGKPVIQVSSISIVE